MRSDISTLSKNKKTNLKKTKMKGETKNERIENARRWYRSDTKYFCKLGPIVGTAVMGICLGIFFLYGITTTAHIDNPGFYFGLAIVVGVFVAVVIPLLAYTINSISLKREIRKIKSGEEE